MVLAPPAPAPLQGPPPARTVTLSEALRRLAQFDGPPERFLEELLSLQCQLAGASAAVACRAEGWQPRPQAVFPASAAAEAPRWMPFAVAAGSEALRRGSSITRSLPELDPAPHRLGPVTLIALPMAGGAVHVFLVRTPSPELDLAARLQRLELTGVLPDLAEARQAARRGEANLEALGLALHTLHAVNTHGRFTGAAMGLVNELATRLGADRVSLGVLRGRYARLVAVSHTEHLQRDAEAARLLELAMEESLDQDEIVQCPPPSGATCVNRAVADLAGATPGNAAAVFPVRQGAVPRAAVVIERAERPFQPQEIESLRLALDLVAPRLFDLHEGDRPWPIRAAVATGRALRRAGEPRHVALKAGVLLTVVALGAAVLVQGVYRVESKFVFEATHRRVVAAPFDGFLDAAAAEAGDAVAAGETVLAELDATALSLELAERRAEHARYHREGDLARREMKSADAAIAAANADRVAAQISLLEHQIRQARIVAPMTGVVLQGDLANRIGGPVNKGDVLFEVGDPASIRAVLLVPEGRIADLRHGQRGELAAAAHPGEPLWFTVERIQPVAEVVDGQNVFRVRATLETSPDWLRPGVEGVARVDAGRASIGWIWTRAAIDWLRMTLWV